MQKFVPDIIDINPRGKRGREAEKAGSQRGRHTDATRYARFSGFHLPERWLFHTDSWTYCACTSCGALIYAQMFVQIFCAHFLFDFLVRNAQIILQIFHRFFFGVSAVYEFVPESRKNPHKICGRICGVPMA